MLNGVKSLFAAHTGAAVEPPRRTAAQLKPEHFVADPSTLRYPSQLDFSHASFKLRDVSLLEQVPKGAAQLINLGGNELTTLEVVNRFQQLRTVIACANSLQVGGGLVLRLPKLVELDLSSNRLVAVPPLGELPQLQVLRLQRNQIARNWGELSASSGTLRELDVSHNRLAWQQRSGEFDAAMHVLASLKKLKELRLGGNPISETPALRYLVLTYTPRLSRLDGLAVTEGERTGRAMSSACGAAAGGGSGGAGGVGGSAGGGVGGGTMMVAMQSAMIVPPGASDDEDDGGGGDRASRCASRHARGRHPSALVRARGRARSVRRGDPLEGADARPVRARAAAAEHGRRRAPSRQRALTRLSNGPRPPAAPSERRRWGGGAEDDGGRGIGTPRRGLAATALRGRRERRRRRQRRRRHLDDGGDLPEWVKKVTAPVAPRPRRPRQPAAAAAAGVAAAEAQQQLDALAARLSQQVDARVARVPAEAVNGGGHRRGRRGRRSIRRKPSARRGGGAAERRPRRRARRCSAWRWPPSRPRSAPSPPRG